MKKVQRTYGGDSFKKPFLSSEQIVIYFLIILHNVALDRKLQSWFVENKKN